MIPRISLGVVLAINAIVSSSASMVAGWGWYGIAYSAIVVAVLSYLCFAWLGPVFAKSDRGVALLQSIKDIGLIDIENRNQVEKALPPSKFLLKAHREVFIIAVSAAATFRENMKVIKQLIDEGKVVHVLILHPESPAAEDFSARQGRDVPAEIRQTVDTIKRNGLNVNGIHSGGRRGFRLKFLNQVPHSIGIMVDGDIEPRGNAPQDNDAQVRVQFVPTFAGVHLGMVFQLKNNGRDSGFHFVADEFRHLWNEDGKEDNSLFT